MTACRSPRSSTLKPSASRMPRRGTPNSTRASPLNSCSTRTACWRRRPDRPRSGVRPMQPAQRMIEVVVEGRQRKCRMRRSAIVALLLLGPTSALAADPAAGQKIFQTQCGICHAVAPGQNRIGPTLFGVVGRRSGSVPGFNYTADHKKLDVTWDAATLDKYLTNPRAMVPDTSMVYPGLKDSAERADLVAYLETLH